MASGTVPWNDPPHGEEHSLTCLNCGAALTGPFCAVCGQRDVPAYPSVRELTVDAMSEFSGYDGRLSSTLRALVLRPGVLTHEFLEGRRARYISPLRLYLTASLVYFLLAAGAPDGRLDSDRKVGLNFDIGPTESGEVASRPKRVAITVGGSLQKNQALTSAERDSARKMIARAPVVMQPALRRAVTDPSGFKRRIIETMPRMLFMLLPIFAGILALFYRHRRYPEHLYFAIHLHAFIFLALTMSEVTKYTQLPILVALAGLVAFVWIPVYATLAFRRVYGARCP